MSISLSDFCSCDLFVTGAFIYFFLCGIGCHRPSELCDCLGHTRFLRLRYVIVMPRLSAYM